MRRIILPQAARVIVPPLGNEFNNMMKTSSLLFFIGVYELFGDAESTTRRAFQPVEYFVAVAVLVPRPDDGLEPDPVTDRAQARGQ